MTTTTNFNVGPYYDDYDEDKNFHRVLFRPAVPVQARELTQLQTILQNQIERFGDNIYQTGTLIKGCSFNYDPQLKYIKVLDQQTNGQDVAVGILSNTYVFDSNGLKADVITVSGGLESQAPDLNTLYIKYLNTGTAPDTSEVKSFAPGSVVTVYQKTYPLESITVNDGGSNYSNSDVIVITPVGSGSGAAASIVTYPANGTIRSVLITNQGNNYTSVPSISVTSGTGAGANLAAINYKAQLIVANSSFSGPTGNSYLATVSDGILYQKGFFTRVDSQNVVVSKYTNIPNNVSLGFNVVESVVNSSIDTTLLDNASGYTNFQAPGANRLKLTPTLVAIPTTAAVGNSNFYSLVDFEDGQIIRDRTETQFNSINTELARRTYEESGNYVVSPFSITSRGISSNTTHLNIVVGPGLGYVSGHRVEQLNNARIAITKGTDEKTDTSQTISTNFGSYVYVKEAIGYFDIAAGTRISLRNTAGTDITDNAGGAPSTPGAQIGTAYVRSVVYDSGTPGTPDCIYRLYLFNIVMNASYRFDDVRSITDFTGGVAIADIVLENSRAVLHDKEFDTLVFPSGTFAVKNFSNEQYIYRTVNTPTFTLTGTFQINTLGAGETWPFTAGSTLNSVQKRQILVTPLTTLVSSSNKTGTVTTNGTTTVTGSGTTFTSEYLIGQFIKVGTQTPSRIVSIANNISLTTANSVPSTTANVHTIAYPAYVPINTTPSVMTIDGTGKVLTFSLGHNLTGTGTVAVTHDVEIDNADVKTKTLVNDVYVKISNTAVAASLTGPWTLGIPDVFRVTGVWAGTGASYSNTGTNISSEFVFSTGQRSSFYSHGSLSKKPGSSLAITTNTNLLVRLSAFTHSAGKYLSTESYPVNDSSPTSTQITSGEIPVFISATTGRAISLRDAIDFRPIVANTAAYSTTVAGATIDPSSTISFAAGTKYFPSPEGNFQGDIVSYLARKDVIHIDKYGRVDITKGTSSNNPVPPAVPRGVMVLGIVNVPPYPTLSAKQAGDLKRPEYATLISGVQQKNFTMTDIQRLADRVTRLEYYTSLNALELQVKNLVIPSGVDASVERFKNGFFVDSFDTYSVSNLQDFEMSALIDVSSSILRPALEEYNIVLKQSASLSSNTVIKGSFALLNYTETEAISQPIATSQRRLTDRVWIYSGTAVLFPAFDTYYDTTTTPTNVLVDTTYTAPQTVSNSTDSSTTATTISIPSTPTTTTQTVGTSYSTTVPAYQTDVYYSNFWYTYNPDPWVKDGNSKDYASF